MKISAGLPTGVSAALFDSARRRRRLEARLSGLLEERGFAEVLLPILDYFEPYRPLLTGRRLEQLYRFVDSWARNSSAATRPKRTSGC